MKLFLVWPRYFEVLLMICYCIEESYLIETAFEDRVVIVYLCLFKLGDASVCIQFIHH